MNNPNQNLDQIFGTIAPPPGMNIGTGDPKTALANFASLLLTVVFLVAGIISLIQLLWGSFDWITSGGDKEKLSKAQKKLTGAVIGLVILFAVVSLWMLVAGNILGIIDVSSGGIIFKLPSFRP